MAGKLTLKQGTALVKLARKSIQYYLASGSRLREISPDRSLTEQRGVFVTLHTYPGNALRGCIGFPYPIKPLWNAVLEAVVEAAVNDTRFAPIKAEQLPNVVIELSVLTNPEEVFGDRKHLPKNIKVGEDGLMVKRDYHSGLLLPQVATEQGWDAETFLGHCCLKAGLMLNMWQSKETHVYRFQAQIFWETKPGGQVEEKKD